LNNLCQVNSRKNNSCFEWLCLALIITYAAHQLPVWIFSLTWRHIPQNLQAIGHGNYYDLLTLAYGLLLTVGCAKRSGLRIGAIRPNMRGTLIVCAIPVFLTALIYPHLPVRPFADQPIGMWLISPLAQDLVFAGFLYGRFEGIFNSYIHPRFRISWALVVTGIFFSAWHLPGLGHIATGYLIFQLVYTFVGFVFVGLARQWTGSIFYGVATHMAVNFIAWYVG